MKTAEVEKLIQKSFPKAKISVSDSMGTGDHFEITVVSDLFRGKSVIEQHRMVHQALGDEMDRGIHAVQIKTQIGQ